MSLSVARIHPLCPTLAVPSTPRSQVQLCCLAGRPSVVDSPTALPEQVLPPLGVQTPDLSRFTGTLLPAALVGLGSLKLKIEAPLFPSGMTSSKNLASSAHLKKVGFDTKQKSRRILGSLFPFPVCPLQARGLGKTFHQHVYPHRLKEEQTSLHAKQVISAVKAPRPPVLTAQQSLCSQPPVPAPWERLPWISGCPLACGAPARPRVWASAHTPPPPALRPP